MKDYSIKVKYFSKEGLSAVRMTLYMDYDEWKQTFSENLERYKKELDGGSGSGETSSFASVRLAAAQQAMRDFAPGKPLCECGLHAKAKCGGGQ